MRAAYVVFALVATVAAGAAVAPLATAQTETCSSPTMTLGPTVLPFQPGESRDYDVSLTNPNQVEATASVTATVPDGWTVEEPDDVTIESNGDEEVTLTVVAPEEDGTEGAMDVEAVLTCGTAPFTQQSEPATQSRELAYDAPGLPWAWIAAGAVGLVAAGGGVAAYRRRPDGLETDCPQPVQEAEPGGRASFDLAVENPLDAPDTAAIRVRDPPPGWRAFSTVDHVELGPAEVRNPTVAVVLPEGVQPGDSGRLAVDVTSERSGESTTVPLRVDVAGPEDESSVGPDRSGNGDAPTTDGSDLVD